MTFSENKIRANKKFTKFNTKVIIMAAFVG